jgi:hypothetical protein
MAGGVASGRGRGVCGWDQMRVDLRGELMNDPGQLGVGMQLQLTGDEVVVGFGLLVKRPVGSARSSRRSTRRSPQVRR